MNFMRSFDIVASYATRMSTLIAPILPLTDTAAERKDVHRRKYNFFFAMISQWEELNANERRHEMKAIATALILALFAMVSGEAWAQGADSSSTTISVKSRGRSVYALLFRPKGTGRFPVITTPIIGTEQCFVDSQLPPPCHHRSSAPRRRSTAR